MGFFEQLRQLLFASYYSGFRSLQSHLCALTSFHHSYSLPAQQISHFLLVYLQEGALQGFLDGCSVGDHLSKHAIHHTWHLPVPAPEQCVRLP